MASMRRQNGLKKTNSNLKQETRSLKATDFSEKEKTVRHPLLKKPIR